MLPALAWLAVACAAYEETPFERQPGDDEVCASEGVACAGGRSGAGGTGSRAGGSTSTPGGSSSSAGRDSSGGGGNTEKGGAGAGGSAPEPPAGSAGQPSSAGSIGSSGSAAGGNAAGAHLWSFEQGTEGWTLRDQSPELTATLTPGAGAVQLVNVPFSAAKQFVDVAFTFPASTDLRGRTLRATVRRTAGQFVGVQLYVYGGAWASPGFESLSSGSETVLMLSLDALAATGVTPASVSRVGLKFGTGSNISNTFGATTIEVMEVALE